MYVRLLTNNFLSEKAVGKSESKDVHLAVLRVLPEVIRESVDADASSKSVIIYDPATGEKKMVSPTAVDGIESLGEVKTAEQREAEINARMQDTIQRGKDWLEGNVANPVGMQIQLGDGRIATIEAMHEDGKSAIATLPDGTQLLVPNDVLQRIVNNGQYADYKARRDAEASKREAEQSTESAPETATEGGQPLPEEASPKEEERREYAQGDVFDVVVDGNKMHAEIVSPKDADGRFVVNVDDGESMRTLYVTPEELAAMEYRENPSTKAEETGLATEGSSEKALERGEQPTEEHTPTALERIPRDEKGNAQFHDVDTETAWDGLVEMSGNEETAHKVAEASIANAEKKLKAAKALKEKGDTPEELLRSIKENEAAVAEAQRVVDAWKAIVGEKARREEAAKAEAERIAAEKAEEEARVEAERKAEEERIAKEEERKERDENGQPFVVSSDGTTTFGEITEDTGLTAAPIKLSEGFQDANTGKGYGLVHIEANHGEQIRQAGFTSVKEFVSFVATHYDPDNIRVGKRRDDGSDTFLIQVTDTHDNTLFIELSKDGSYWNVNSGGIFRKGYSNKKETVAKTEPQQPTNAVSSDSSLSANVKDGITNAEPNGEPTVSLDKGTTLPADQQTSDKENTKKVTDSEGENTLKAKIEAASADVNTEPTEAQKEAGNYKKGHVQVGTFDITIEQPEGSIRRGTDADGKKWESKMHNTYGYFRGTEGVDGDHIDVFLSNDIDGWNGRKVFVVDQYNPDGTFDEHKVMLGFNDMDEAKSDYLANYEKGWENGRRIDVSATNLKDFEKWIDSSHRKTKPFSEYSSVNKGSEKAEKKQKKQSVFDKAKEIADKEEKKRKAEAEDDSVLGQATRAVGKKKKVNRFKYTASKIISYPALRGVHYANGYAYASDGYILFKEKADYPKEWEGTTRDKDGNLIDGKYPDTEKAIHRLVHIPDKEVESLPSKEVLDFAIAASKKLKGEAIPVAIDGLFFNAVNLKKFLEAVASKGMDKVVYRHPMLYATNGKDEIVMMPTVNTLEGALDIADKMESAGLPKEQIDAWKAHIEAADKEMSFEDFKKAVENANKEGVRPTEADKQESKAEAEKQKVDKQGNPIDAEGRLITEKVEDISDLSDDDFNNPKRSVELPKIPKNIDNALGANGKPVIIKKNIFERNKNAHSDLTAEQSREILKTALYSADLYAKNQKSKRPFNWVIIKTKDHDGKNKLVLLEVNDNKDNVEIVHWHYLDDRGLEKIKKQAEREGGQLLILPSEKEEAGALSSRTSDLPADKGSEVGGEKQEAEKKRPAPLSERIEDVGEKIGDARKDVWKEIIARIKNKKQGIEEALKKSSAGKLFSSLFDEKELLESGVSNEVVTFISAVKGSLGTKPRSLSKLKMWINKVLHQYDMCEQALENWESVKKKIDEWKYYSQPFYMYRAAMAVGGYESGRDVGNAELWQIADGYSDGKSVAGQWRVRKAGAYDGIYKTYEEAAEALKKFAGENAAVDGKGKRKEVKLAIYKRRTDGTMFIAPKGKPDVIIQDGFKTLYEASAYKKEHYAEMQERYRTLMDGIKPKFNENRERKGRDWRGGKDVSAEDFREAFDFRGVEFGNWMQQKDRRQALNECYDSLMDLAMVCGVSPKALSLGGKLAMAFGARGVGKFNAHYEPDKVVINLTKTKGAGSLAHEWFHAIDNYFNMQGWDEFATESTRNVERKEMAEAWKDLVRAINGSDYFKRSDKYARLKGSRYWIEPTELGARAFAVWVENRLSKYGTINDYLANNPRLVDEKASDAEKKYAPYPFDKDADWMDEKFGRLFEVMQERVDEETGKHILYSRNKAAGHENTELTAEERELRDNLVERMRKGGLDVVTDSEEMQRVIDRLNERTRMMGAKQKRALETATIAAEATNNATVISSADGAKIQNNLGTLATNYEKIANKTRGFITDLSHALGLKQHESSQYGTFETPDGKRITIRVSNHNARVSNFDKNNESEGISIVISSHKNKGLHNDGNAHIIEYFYPKRALENAEGKPLAEMIRSVSDALAGEEFKDTTGLAEREEVNGSSVREHRVYHGSGADFDAFDHSHMGEGEGAQAYGWGTYVTEVEGIGRTYAIQNSKYAREYPVYNGDSHGLSEGRINEILEVFLDGVSDETYILRAWDDAMQWYSNKKNDDYAQSLVRDASLLNPSDISIAGSKTRNLYTVEIPDDNGDNYLDWNGHPAESLLKDVGSFLESEGFERVQDNPVRYEKGESTVVLNPKATGADLYAELREALGSDKKASQALAELGCIGIKYPADNMRGGRKDGAKNYVIFNENDAKITDHTRFLRTADGEVYGLVKDGRIYLDPKVATAETAVHEYTHLWGDMLRRKDSEQWSHTVKELKNSVLWEEVKELYPELKTDDEIADEVLSTFSGRRGAERLREEARRVADGEGGVFTKAKAMAALENVKNAIARFWGEVARMFGINRYRSAEELADMAMRDLINGVKPTSRTFTFDNFYKDTKAVFEGTERPKGKPDYISYSGSEYWYGEDKGGKYVVRGSDHWSGEFKVKDGERTNVGRNHYSEITEDGMLPIGAQGSLKFGWEKGLSKPVGSGISAAIDRRGSGDSNNIASCYWYIDNAKEKDNKGFTYGKAYLSEFEDKERRRDIPGDDWRDIQGVEGNARAMAVKKANDRFNEELEMQVKGELEEGHVYKLGMPSEILLSTGVPNLPIQMSAQRLEDKATKFGHNFDIAEVKDLVNAIQKPIAIFEYGDRNKSQNLIVEIQKDGKNFIIGLSLNPVVKGKALEINSVRNVFPKDNAEWLNWISQNKLLYADKEKIQALIDKQQTNLADVNYLNLDDVAKKVKDFENPKLFDGKISEVDKKGSDSTDRSVRENPKNEDKPRFSRKPGESIFDYASRVSEDVDRSVRERVSARDEYEKKVKSKGFQTKEALQNSMLGLQEFMSAIDHASGNKRYIEDIPDFENPILGENRLSSVNKEEMHQVAKTQFKPLMSAVAKLSGNGKESGELYDYMFAKHGLERDAVMRQREAQKEFDKYQKANPKGTKTIGDFVASLEGKDYAGLTALTAEDGRVKSIQSQIDAIDEQMKATDDQLLLRKLGGQKKRLKVDLLNAARDAADDIRKAFESNPSHNRSDINELWSRVNEVNGNTLRKLYESGMLTKEAYNDISSMYTNYIPMRGFDQTTSADAYAYLTHGDSAFNAPIKTAKGRSSKADNPIAYMQAMAESAIMQGNRNVLVKQKMLNFVRNHPSDLASVSDVWLQYDSVADEWKPVYAFGRESKG